MEGSAASVERLFKRSFRERFNIEPESFIVTQTDLLIDSDGPQGGKVWVGSMEATLVMDGETFVCSRDWLEEYNIDRQHPKYDDDWFYDGTDNHSYKKAIELIDKVNSSDE